MSTREPAPPGGNARFTLGGEPRAGHGDTLDDPVLFDGTVGRRVMAYVIDVAILFALNGAAYLLVIMTLGLFAVFLPFLIILPFAYHILTVSSAAQATVGQRMMGLKVVTNWGEQLPVLQAAVLTILFYMTLSLTGGLLLLWALFDDRGRCLHDIVSGALVVRAESSGT